MVSNLIQQILFVFHKWTQFSTVKYRQVGVSISNQCVKSVHKDTLLTVGECVHNTTFSLTTQDAMFKIVYIVVLTAANVVSV